MSSVGDSIGMIWFCIICLILMTAIVGEKNMPIIFGVIGVCIGITLLIEYPLIAIVGVVGLVLLAKKNK